MKKLILMTMLAAGSLTAHADDGYAMAYGSYPYRAYAYPATPVLVSAAPVAYSPYYSYSAYPYSSGYSSGQSSSRPNYAVGGTLLGAGIGAIIGNNVHHQTWQGAAIGAASGLLLGGLAERNARSREQKNNPAPMLSYALPVYVEREPSVPAAPPANITYKPVNSMSGANSLFGR